MTALQSATESGPPVHIGSLIRRAQQRHLALWQEHVSAEISSVQYAALDFLERNPGASQSELGVELDVDPSTVTDLVRRMQRHGLLERLRHETDGRRYALRLTAAGHLEVGRLRPLVDLANATLTARLSEQEQTTLRALLRRVVSAPERS